MILIVKKLHEHAITPTFATESSSGMDIYAAEEKTIWNKGNYGTVRTGIAVAIPEGYEGQVRSRSGLAAKFGVSVLNSPGTIDADYRGEILVVLINHGLLPYKVRLGERIAQLVVCPVERAAITEVESLPKTDRGSGGFGSTGK
jgi:dUTP pyrophosphatase